jgi:hypothetical protein
VSWHAGFCAIERGAVLRKRLALLIEVTGTSPVMTVFDFESQYHE